MLIEGKQYESVWFDGKKVSMIDQRRLPHDFQIANFYTASEVAQAITDMVVRGAPAIGAAGIYGMALTKSRGEDLDKAYSILLNSRPTAYDLKDGLDYFAKTDGDPLEVSRHYCKLSSDRCKKIGEHGFGLLKPQMNVLTHCNAGALACVDWGTALSPFRIAKQNGVPVHVWVDETRPRCQGARITAWELMQEGISHTLIADNVSGHLMRAGEVDAVIVGADRIAANGDVANKIGTYEKAVLARENNIPFYVAAPSSTFDRSCPSGDDIPIEERGAEEVTHMFGLSDDGKLSRVRVTYSGCPVKNIAFDVTPKEYVTGYITEDGVFDTV